jgi:hypothetical protein
MVSSTWKSVIPENVYFRTPLKALILPMWSLVILHGCLVRLMANSIRQQFIRRFLTIFLKRWKWLIWYISIWISRFGSEKITGPVGIRTRNLNLARVALFNAKRTVELRAQIRGSGFKIFKVWKNKKKGGDPAAGSPTATLWRLNPPRKA